MPQMKKWITFFCWIPVLFATGQTSEGFRELKKLCEKQEVLPTDSSLFLSYKFNNGIHYLSPLYKAIYRERELKKQDSGFYYEMLTRSLCLAGDYASVLSIEKQRYLLPEDISGASIDTLTNVISEYADARKFILGQSAKQRVVMSNEANNRPQHCAFVLSLLEGFYKQGFRYLAMEMLYNETGKQHSKLNAAMGYYTAEPVAGELIRKALELGFTLVPYEDNQPDHTAKQREYTQAKHLADFISLKDSTAKLLVLAGYGHIEEAALSDERIPMAAYFKILTGINPYTIDQTGLTEYSSLPYQTAVYDAWIRKHPAGNPSVILTGKEPFDLFGLHLYDLQVLHPPTKIMNERPTWLSAGGLKKETPVAAAYRSTFFVQAYYEEEYNEKTVQLIIPADQTYCNAANGLYYLYLRKGKYKIIFRDKLYKQLGVKEMTVE